MQFLYLTRVSFYNGMLSMKLGFNIILLILDLLILLANVPMGLVMLPNTKAYIVNLKPLVNYIFTVYAVNCIGIGPESENVTFNVTAYSK